MTPSPSCDVLIVEDDPATASQLIVTLRMAGFGIDVADDVVEAKRLLSRGSYAVLVLGLVLPNGTALDLLDFIKFENLGPANTIIIAFPDAPLLAQLDHSLVNIVMVKPIILDDFLEAVHALAVNESARPL